MKKKLESYYHFWTEASSENYELQKKLKETIWNKIKNRLWK